MPDFNAITTALAGRYAPGVVTPPVGTGGSYDNITVSTGYLPDQMLPTPCVLVFSDTGQFTHSPGKRDGVGTWLVRFYFNQAGDLERDTEALERWATVLVDQLKLASQLGGIVTQAKCLGWKIGILPYAGVSYTGIELTVMINTNEPWAAVS